MKELQLILDTLERHPSRGAALATLVEVEGSSYRRPGARKLVLEDGTAVGMISGGCLEQDVVERARQTLASGESQIVVYDTTQDNDLIWGVGLGCQGIIRILVEKLPSAPQWVAQLRANFRDRRATELIVIHRSAVGGHSEAEADACGTFLGSQRPELRGAEDSAEGVFCECVPPPAALMIFGAGDDAIPLVRMAHEVGWHVSVCDSRATYASRARFPDAQALIVVAAAGAAARVPLDARVHAVVMTHRYSEDATLLRWLLAQPLAYLGVLGPRSRTARILSELGEPGVPATREHLYAPIGLDIGGSTPENVAISILAELQAVQSGRAANHLRARTRPIHASGDDRS